MADSVELRMSVTAITRVDPSVKEILCKSTHVALYKFNPTTNLWERTETEGALFVYNRIEEPYHSMIILNRLNTNNLMEPIVKEFEYQMQTPFLLYRNSKNKIFGIWFYNKDECVNITLVLESVMESFREKEKVTERQEKENVNLYELLSRAQEDYNKTPIKNETNPLQFSSTPRTVDMTSQSVMDFFSKVSTKTATKQVPAVGDGNIQHTLQRLMSNPAHSVEHIEKQQRSITPQEIMGGRSKTNSLSEQNSIFSKPMEQNKNTDLSRQNMGAAPSPLANFLSQSLQHNLVAKDDLKDDKELTSGSPLAQFLETPQKPALMPPMMFASHTRENNLVSIFQNQSNHTENNQSLHIEPLTRNQMLQAFNYLLKHDTDFVTKLHEAYVKSLFEMVSQNNHTVI